MILLRSIFVLFVVSASSVALSQTPPAPTPAPQPPPTIPDTQGGNVSAPVNVKIDPTAADTDIAKRLLKILELTNWFENISVDVQEGVVFLKGVAKRDEHRKWAGDLATKTEDVVAVVNRITLANQPLWNFTGVSTEVTTLGRQTIQSMPLIGIGLLILVLTWLVTSTVAAWARKFFHRRLGSLLLSDMAARAVAVVTFIAGLYLALRISGLTQIAVTLLGGTGLLGLVIGIAFRDIAENFLASILISIQRPFVIGDLIEVGGSAGYVRSVTMRGTLLLMQDGNYVQIPNAVIYKSVIKNMSANPKMRVQFDAVCSLKKDVAHLQERIMQKVQSHEAVLDDPEPMVLLESATVDSLTVRVYCWIDGVKHSVIKVRSALLRETLGIIAQADSEMVRQPEALAYATGVPQLSNHQNTKPVEGDFANDAKDIRKQADQSRLPDQGENLLSDKPQPVAV